MRQKKRCIYINAVNDMNLTFVHEWELAAKHKIALEKEDYELCALIKAEVNNRIVQGTINHSLMQGFRKFDPATQKFVGDPKYTGLNNLFEKYDFNLPNSGK